jgi:hypothetical protein
MINMYPEQSLKLDHPGSMPPAGSVARASFDNLNDQGIKIVMNPHDADNVTEEFIADTFLYGNPDDDHAQALARASYEMWRNVYPDMRLFTAQISSGQLLVAAAVTPGARREEATTCMWTFGDELLSSNWLASFEVIHSYVARKTKLMKHGSTTQATDVGQLTKIMYEDLGYQDEQQPIEPVPEASPKLMVMSPEQLEHLSGGPAPQFRLRRRFHIVD